MQALQLLVFRSTWPRCWSKAPRSFQYFSHKNSWNWYKITKKSSFFLIRGKSIAKNYNKINQGTVKRSWKVQITLKKSAFSSSDLKDQKSNVMMIFSSSLPTLKFNNEEYPKSQSLTTGKIPKSQEIKVLRITGKYSKEESVLIHTEA